MGGWHEAVASVASNVEDHYDLLKYRLRERLGGRDPIMILPYRGFGSQHRLYLKGRVLENRDISPAADDDSIWDNLANMYKRFKSNEIPHARLLARYQNVELEVETNEEGFFEIVLEPTQPLPKGALWQHIELELLKPKRGKRQAVRATGDVLIPPPTAQFGVISDIDDTVLYTDATTILKMARTVFLSNARMRLPFKGVAAFYRALHEGGKHNAGNPLFYISSSPWNLYDLLSDFFHLHDIPIGPVLLLRDWGLKDNEFLPVRHRQYKLGQVVRVMETYPDLPFILIGDSGQKDPEIYRQVVEKYPGRVPAVYIRNATHDLERPDAVRALAQEVADLGSTLILAENTLPMAQHAMKNGWISTQSLPLIWDQKEADEAPPSRLEQILGEEPKGEGPTVAMQADQVPSPEEAVDEALKTGDARRQKPPSVIIEGNDDK